MFARCGLTMAFGLACNPTRPAADSRSAATGDAQAGHASAAPAGEEAATPMRREPGPPEGSTDDFPGLEGRTADEVRAELGPPDHEREFPMSECCTEFQIELYNTYPPDGAHAKVRIREWTWLYGGYRVTSWLHAVDETWTVLDSSRYRDDVEF